MKVDFEDYCKKWNVSFLKFENTLNIKIKYKKRFDNQSKIKYTLNIK